MATRSSKFQDVKQQRPRHDDQHADQDDPHDPAVANSRHQNDRSFSAPEREGERPRHADGGAHPPDQNGAGSFPSAEHNVASRQCRTFSTPTARDQQSGEYLSRGGGDSSRADALYDRGLDLVQAAEAGRSAAQSRAADPEQVRQEPQPTGTTPVTGGMVERSGNRGDGVKRLVHCPSPFKRLGGGRKCFPTRWQNMPPGKPMAGERRLPGQGQRHVAV